MVMTGFIRGLYSAYSSRSSGGGGADSYCGYRVITLKGGYLELLGLFRYRYVGICDVFMDGLEGKVEIGIDIVD